MSSLIAVLHFLSTDVSDVVRLPAADLFAFSSNSISLLALLSSLAFRCWVQQQASSHHLVVTYAAPAAFDSFPLDKAQTSV